MLGHGSGKLFYAGNYPPELTCPLSGDKVGTYGPGDTYDSVFTSIGSRRECRAEYFPVSNFMPCKQMLTMLFRSWAERFDDANEIDSILSKLADKDKQYW